MKRLALATTLLVVLVSAVTLSSSVVGVAEAAASGVYINADGSVQGTTSIQRIEELYTFTGDFAGPLYVQRDNIVVDGTGYTVTGANGRGIVLQGRHGVTLRNTRVTLDGGYVIDVEDASDCTLMGNTLVGTPQPIPGLPSSRLIGPYGVNFLHSLRITVKDNLVTNFSSALSLEWSSGHTITGNTFVDGINGIDLWNSYNCMFRNNQLRNCSFSMRVYPSYQYENNLDPSNTIDGKPIYYWLNLRDRTVPSDAAYVALVGCVNIHLESANPKGITLVSTRDTTVSRMSMVSGSDGISLLNCSGVRIVDSVLRGAAIGIELQNSFNNTVSGNEISNCGTRGLSLHTGDHNVISNNTFAGNSYAIAPFQDSVSNGIVILSNLFMNNSYALTVQGSMTIQGNVFEGSEIAVFLTGSSGCTITQNTFRNNMNGLYLSSSSGNMIYLNNFVNNTHQVADAGASNTSTQATGSSFKLAGSLQLATFHVREMNFLPPPLPSSNSWDNGSRGNYWSDYRGSDVNDDGVGDVAYAVYGSNRDNYPLMRSVDVSEVFSVPEFPFGYASVAMLSIVGVSAVLIEVFLKHRRVTI